MTMPQYRTIWISDLHIGSTQCQADVLLDFLKHNESEKLYLGGDIIDFWALSNKMYCPPDHNTIIQNRGVAIFAKACLGASQPQQTAKITRPLLPAAAPIRPRRLVSTQLGVETWASNDLTAFRGFLRFATETRPALRLSGTKNLHFAYAPFPRFSALELLRWRKQEEKHQEALPVKDQGEWKV